MINLFNINFEFDKTQAQNTIIASINEYKRGYVCAVDTNIVAVANSNSEYLHIINNSLLNICDGGTIATIGSRFYKQSLCRYTGPDLFLDFVSKGYRQAFLGNTPENLLLLKKKMQDEKINTACCIFQALPFCEIDEFDYKGIADSINQNEIELVWISLGAPKQETFAHKLLPYIDKSVLIAVGAAFNFYIGQGIYHRAPKWMQKMNIEWIYRLGVEPRKQFKRIVSIMKIYPLLIWKEYRYIHKNKKL